MVILCRICNNYTRVHTPALFLLKFYTVAFAQYMFCCFLVCVSFFFLALQYIGYVVADVFLKKAGEEVIRSSVLQTLTRNCAQSAMIKNL